MTGAQELIKIVESAGGRFIIDGDRLGIIPATAAEPVMEELREHKAELMAELARRPAMPAGVRLVSWSPKEAPVRLSSCSTVTDVERFIRLTLRQVEARLKGKDWLACWTLSTLLDRLAICGCILVLDDPQKELQ
jgi:hypothetical protein